MTNSNDNNNNSTANLGTDPDPATAAAIAAALQEDTSPPTTRSTRSSANKRSASQEQQQQPETKRSKSSNGNGGGDVKGLAAVEEAKRPNAHEILEEYVDFCANMMLPSPSPLGAPSYHSLPTLSALRFLQSPQRRRTVWEDWSPYQIALFEAGMGQHGKDFYAISKELEGRKTTKQIIDFYYLWKKTTHYKKWKKTYIPAHLDVSDDEEEQQLDAATDKGSSKDSSSGNGKSGK